MKVKELISLLEAGNLEATIIDDHSYKLENYDLEFMARTGFSGNEKVPLKKRDFFQIHLIRGD
ncbi:MAG: hypothetical protein QF864_08250 [SAR202 cluster bacterium]|jgi:hypothetical protein|nr:hypothetical protein [SAR202 cluster bacterium]